MGLFIPFIPNLVESGEQVQTALEWRVWFNLVFSGWLLFKSFIGLRKSLHETRHIGSILLFGYYVDSKPWDIIVNENIEKELFGWVQFSWSRLCNVYR